MKKFTLLLSETKTISSHANIGKMKKRKLIQKISFMNGKLRNNKKKNSIGNKFGEYIDKNAHTNV